MQTERALSGGVLQGYRVFDEALQVVRGRIRIGDQITRRPGLMIPIEVTYDDFTTDIPENQLLRSAPHRLLAVPRLPARTRTRLGHLSARLQNVRIIRPGNPLPPWQASRLNQRYQPALRLASLILRTMSAEPGPGGIQVASFVVPMWKVFEDFVATALTEALRGYPGRTQTRPQYTAYLDQPQPGQPSAIKMALDVAHLVHSAPRLIFDAKYKTADPHGQYPNADHYQMLAYCTALSVPNAWLVYAQGTGTPRQRAIKNTAITIIEYSLDLSVPPPSLLHQVDDLATTAWSSTLDTTP